MGYSHHFKQLRDVSPHEWRTISRDVRTIFDYAQTVYGINLGDGMGNPPHIDSSAIWVEGVCSKSYDTFLITRRIEKRDDLCATYRYEYDTVVVACLCYLATVAKTHFVKSDGKLQDLKAGLSLARAALPHYSIDYPRGVLEDERWIEPPLACRSLKFDFVFGRDGYAYIINKRTGESYRFSSHDEAKAFAFSHHDKSHPDSRLHFQVFQTRWEWRAPARAMRIAAAQTRVLENYLEGERYLRPQRFVAPPATVREMRVGEEQQQQQRVAA